MSQIVADFQVNGLLPSTVGGTGTTVKYFGRNVAFAQGATWTSPLVPSSTNANGVLLVPGDNKMNGQKMVVTAAGSYFPASAATSESVEVALYGVTGTLTSPTYTKLATSGSFTPGADGVSYNFTIIATLMGTTASGVVGGNQYVIINNTIQTSLAALTNSLTGIVFGQSGSGSNQVQSGLGGAPFGLVVGITFGSSFSTNAASLNEFVIEA